MRRLAGVVAVVDGTFHFQFIVVVPQGNTCVLLATQFAFPKYRRRIGSGLRCDCVLLGEDV
jgi:hypothetical protein